MNRTLLSALCAILAGIGAAPAQAASPDIQVYYATSTKEFTALRVQTPELSFAGQELDTPEGSQIFLAFRAAQPVKLEVRDTTCNAGGRVVRGKVLEEAQLDATHAFALRGEISEGCPTRSVCLAGTDTCWEPFVSGEDGSLMLSEPFTAWNAAPGVHLIVTDSDRAGTNVRDLPAGKVTDVIGWVKKSDPDTALHSRIVFAIEQQGKWVRVSHAPGRTGWMHASVLGSCTPFEETKLRSSPSPKASGQTVPAGTRLRLVQLLAGWARVKTPQGETGWLPYEQLFSNPYSNCWLQ